MYSSIFPERKQAAHNRRLVNLERNYTSLFYDFIIKTNKNITFTSLIDSGIISKKSRVLFVDDGSKDKTLEILEEIATQFNQDDNIKILLHSHLDMSEIIDKYKNPL